ncbi:MAG: FtsK/SpoIIIE domain-containing protein [Pseudonocardia sp.]
MSTTTLILLAGLLPVLWVLHQLGKGVTWVLEAVAVIAVVFVTAWLAIKGCWKAARWAVLHWRTTLAVVTVTTWCELWGWRSLAIATSWAVEVVGVWWLVAWRIDALAAFDALVGRHLRGWWQRWIVYAIPMPKWFRNCRLTIPDAGQAVTVNVNPFRKSGLAPRIKPRRDQIPRIVGVRSGASWDEVRVKLVAGLTPEDVDQAARALAVARGVARCQVRELTPNVVSIDFQRRNLLAGVVTCQNLAELAAVAGESIDLGRVWSGCTEYGLDWYQSLRGGHTLNAGSTGAGKNSVMWSPLVSIAPAIRDGLVRVSGIDPKGMELAYGRGIFHRYAVTSRDALAVLDELVEGMEARKTEFAGRVRTVPITRETPLELVEFDEIGALLRYVGDRKIREQITDRVALLTTQGRALGYTVRGYVQEPTKDTVPVRDLFPRRICLRVAAKSHVAMVLGDHAYDRGAWANRIGESEAGVGYLFGEGIREPLRVRAGWVPDDVIKELEAFVTGATDSQLGTVHALPAPAGQRASGGVA